ncbi:MAG: CapA family protein [Clostridia bacterium]|nr:CapA family protein [Clostridia bacterium]
MKVFFTGDIAFSKYFKDSAGDTGLLAEELLEFLRDSDHGIPNVEGALTDRVMVLGDAATPAHASDPKAADRLLQMGGDIWNLSNNHTLDCDKEGLADTITLAASKGCCTLGAGMNIKEAAEPVYCGNAGIFSICYKRSFKADDHTPGNLQWEDEEPIKAAIRAIKKKARWCILVAHGGEEFSDLPMPHAREKYLRYLEWGADIIVGHHPHVPQNYEQVGNKIIFYSLGNLIFDTDFQRIQSHTDQGVLLKLDLQEDSFRWEARGYRIDRERHRILPAALPAVFRPLSAEEYHRLIPLVAERFWRNFKRAKTFLKPQLATATPEEWRALYIRGQDLHAYDIMMEAIRRFPLQEWKNEPADLLQYLNE